MGTLTAFLLTIAQFYCYNWRPVVIGPYPNFLPESDSVYSLALNDLIPVYHGYIPEGHNENKSEYICLL